MGKTLAILQARMGSSRLPGKVLLDLGGLPVLARVLNRAGRAKALDGLVVATTDDISDGPLEDWCKTHAVRVFRGSQFDVLDRFFQAAKQFRAETVVRLTADCPFIDPGEIDRALKVWRQGSYDFVCNRLPPPFKRTTPIGTDVEVVSFANLEKAWREADKPYEREHVMPYFYEESGRFRVKVVNRRPSLGHLRFTVDTPEDLEMARTVYASFDNRDDFTLKELVAASATHPEWQAQVGRVKHKTFMEVDSRAGNGKAYGR